MGRSGDYDDVSIKSKKGGCKHWQVAIVCSLLIAVGLAVGLGVGLSNQQTVIVEDKTTTIDITSPSTPPTTPPGTGPWQDYRLPDYIIPSHYRLKLHPVMETDTYTGSNEMTISVGQKTKYIVVHVDANLHINKTTLQRTGSNENIKIISEFRVPKFEFYVVESGEELEPQDYLLTMEFQGSLVGKVVGLYKSVYTIPGGEVKAMVGSDMEPTDARKAYPCFDEPAMKIRYTTTLVHLPEHVALSNMDVESTINEDGWVQTTFKESVPMSSYLGCFAIGEFDYIQKFSEKQNISLRIYLPPHQISAGRADYAMEAMKTQFDYFEDLFKMNYSLPKLDMISIPDFGTGAMENWGLITFRETNLLWDPSESSTNNKQRVAAVVAHELVHQWYGNIVTMKWWDNIWLNEGFASYLEYFGEDQYEPSWNVLNFVVTDDLQRAMQSDASVTSRSIVSNVTSPEQITSVFDTITYSKGATVLRYLHSVVGDDIFFGSIAFYLQQRQFDNANDQDLIEDIQQYANNQNYDVDVAAILETWLHQMGFPVLTVKLEGSTLNITQERFLDDPETKDEQEPSPFDYKWNIEVSYVTNSNNTTIKRMFNKSEDSLVIEIGALEPGEWVKLNPGQTGYYRVNYDPELLEALKEQLLNNHSRLSEIDRANIIDDVFNLALPELISYEAALNMTEYLDKEKSYFAWDAFERGSGYIQEMLKTTDIYPRYQGYFVKKIKPLADELGWDVADNASHVVKRNRVQALSLALSFNESNANEKATQLFQEWINDETKIIHPDVRALVYEYGVKGVNVGEWEKMLQRYVNEDVATEKANLLRGITSVEDVGWIDRMLSNCWNESIVMSQDFFDCVTYISHTNTGNAMAWTWVQLNWERMVERFTLLDRNFGRLIPNIVNSYNTEIKLWEVESFFERYPDAGAGASGRVSAINSIKSNIKWMEKHQGSIREWLSARM